MGRRGFLGRMLMAPLVAPQVAAVAAAGPPPPPQHSTGPFGAQSAPTAVDDEICEMWDQYHHGQSVDSTYGHAAASAAPAAFKAAPAWRKAEIEAAARARLSERQFRSRRAMQMKEAALRAVGLSAV